MTPSPDRLLTAAEAAARIGVTTTGLTRMERRGALIPRAYSIRGGPTRGTRLYDPADVERIAAARETLKMADRRRTPQAAAH